MWPFLSASPAMLSVRILPEEAAPFSKGTFCCPLISHMHDVLGSFSFIFNSCVINEAVPLIARVFLDFAVVSTIARHFILISFPVGTRKIHHTHHNHTIEAKAAVAFGSL
jgi:hypothetical protein